MRVLIPLVIAAAVAAAPANAQDNGAATAAGAAPETEASGTVPGAGTMNNLDSDAAVATAPTNGLTAGPGAAPETAEPVDLSYGEPAREDRDGFPWGILGLLGLAGLIPRKNRDRTGDL